MKCIQCGKEYEDMLEVDGVGPMCEQCLDEEDYQFCKECGVLFQGDPAFIKRERFKTTEVYICPDCLDTSYLQCDRCGEYYSYGDVDAFPLVDEERRICKKCWDPAIDGD